MAFNGSGVFNRIYNWATDKTNSVPVTASRMDTEDDGFATGLSTCITKDGQQTTTARIPFTLGLSSMAGTASAVSYSQINDTNTGIYFPASDEVALAAGGVQVLDSTATTLTIPIALVTSGAATFAGTIAVSATATVGSLIVGATANIAGNAIVGGILNVTAQLSANASANFTGLVTLTSTSHMLVPVGTTGQRPSNAAGAFRYNSTTGALEYSTASVWRTLKEAPTTQVFTSGSGATYTTPTGVTWIKVRMIGGGGGGGGTTTNAGGNGTASSFNSITAGGGAGGAGATSGTAGAGGTGGSGTANVRINGGSGSTGTSSVFTMGGIGFFGGASVTTAATNTGAGGGSGVNGGGGGAGEYIEIIIANPSATYTYTVGGGGTTGTGNTGGAGAAGLIIVEEYYT